jgi:hypothetical protein
MKLFLTLYDAVGLVAAVSHPLPNLDKCHKMAGDIFVYYIQGPSTVSDVDREMRASL